MKAFADLYTAIDEMNRTTEKVAAMVRYFQTVDPEDGAWAVYFLIGRRPRRAVNSTKMQQWAAELAGIEPWLFQECYDAVGDLAETIAAILPDPIPGATPRGLAQTLREVIIPLKDQNEATQRATLTQVWQELEQTERFVFNKLLTGAFRVGVSQDLVVRALSQAFGVPVPQVAHRLMGDWTPTAATFLAIQAPNPFGEADDSRPYPFCLAHPLEGTPEALGPVADWQAEWKWDGIRAQVIHRPGGVFVWSRGEELIGERFPEIQAIGNALPVGTVIDGEILAWANDRPLPFAELQKRIGRKQVTKKILETVPVTLIAYDLLEYAGVDWRARPLAERRAQLESIPGLRLSETVRAADWPKLADQRATARERGTEGLMLKRLDSPYGVGRKKGAWWKWKIEPYTVDAVLVYAQRGSGKRASLYTDYTFALWRDGELVSFAKAYSGLSDEEIRRVDQFVRRNSIEKFGPVRTVKPEIVMELAFEGIQLSNRHKSGLAVRFPRIARLRPDKKIEDADSLETVRAMLGS